MSFSLTALRHMLALLDAGSGASESEKGVEGEDGKVGAWGEELLREIEERRKKDPWEREKRGVRGGTDMSSSVASSTKSMTESAGRSSPVPVDLISTLADIVAYGGAEGYRGPRHSGRGRGEGRGKDGGVESDGEVGESENGTKVTGSVERRRGDVGVHAEEKRDSESIDVTEGEEEEQGMGHGSEEQGAEFQVGNLSYPSSTADTSTTPPQPLPPPLPQHVVAKAVEALEVPGIVNPAEKLAAPKERGVEEEYGGGGTVQKQHIVAAPLHLVEPLSVPPSRHGKRAFLGRWDLFTESVLYAARDELRRAPKALPSILQHKMLPRAPDSDLLERGILDPAKVKEVAEKEKEEEEREEREGGRVGGDGPEHRQSGSWTSATLDSAGMHSHFSSRVDSCEEEVEGSEVEGSEVEGSEVEGSEVEGSEVEGSEVEGSEVEGSEVEGSEVEDDVTGISGRPGYDEMFGTDTETTFTSLSSVYDSFPRSGVGRGDRRGGGRGSRSVRASTLLTQSSVHSGIAEVGRGISSSSAASSSHLGRRVPVTLPSGETMLLPEHVISLFSGSGGRRGGGKGHEEGKRDATMRLRVVDDPLEDRQKELATSRADDSVSVCKERKASLGKGGGKGVGGEEGVGIGEEDGEERRRAPSPRAMFSEMVVAAADLQSSTKPRQFFVSKEMLAQELRHAESITEIHPLAPSLRRGLAGTAPQRHPSPTSPPTSPTLRSLSPTSSSTAAVRALGVAAPRRSFRVRHSIFYPTMHLGPHGEEEESGEGGGGEKDGAEERSRKEKKAVKFEDGVTGDEKEEEEEEEEEGKEERVGKGGKDDATEATSCPQPHVPLSTGQACFAESQSHPDIALLCGGHAAVNLEGRGAVVARTGVSLPHFQTGRAMCYVEFEFEPFYRSKYEHVGGNSESDGESDGKGGKLKESQLSCQGVVVGLSASFAAVQGVVGSVPHSVGLSSTGHVVCGGMWESRGVAAAARFRCGDTVGMLVRYLGHFSTDPNQSSTEDCVEAVQLTFSVNGRVVAITAPITMPPGADLLPSVSLSNRDVRVVGKFSAPDLKHHARSHMAILESEFSAAPPAKALHPPPIPTAPDGAHPYDHATGKSFLAGSSGYGIFALDGTLILSPEADGSPRDN